MRLQAVLLTRIVLALAVTHAYDTPFRRPWQHSPRSPIDRQRSRHPEPDRTKPQRPFRGGRVRHPKFAGSGCPTDSVVIVNASDTSSFALSALFSHFQAQTANETLCDRRTCTITVALEPTEHMSIGVAHVDFRGSAYVPVGKLPTLARLDASYSLTGGGRSRIANASYTTISFTRQSTSVMWRERLAAVAAPRASTSSASLPRLSRPRQAHATTTSPSP